MKKVFLIFKINNQSVYQIIYNGCVDIEVIGAYKEMIAREYSVEPDEVIASFKDTIIKTNNYEKTVNKHISAEVSNFLKLEYIKN